METLMSSLRRIHTLDALDAERALLVNNTWMSPREERESVLWMCRVRAYEISTGKDCSDQYHKYFTTPEYLATKEPIMKRDFTNITVTQQGYGETSYNEYGNDAPIVWHCNSCSSSMMVENCGLDDVYRASDEDKDAFLAKHNPCTCPVELRRPYLMTVEEHYAAVMGEAKSTSVEDDVVEF